MTFPVDLFAGKTAVVTGGTTGIGHATAQYFAEHGAKVYAVGLDRAKLYDGAPSQIDPFPSESTSTPSWTGAPTPVR